MRIDVRFRAGERSDAVAEHVRRHAAFALGRFATRIDRVVVRLEETSGPRTGALDKVCRIEAHGDFGARLSESRADDFYAASSRALDVLERSVARVFKQEPGGARGPSRGTSAR